MIRPLILTTTILLLSVSSGCYRAVIETATPVGTQTIDIPWAHSFLGGLVPPNLVESAARCPSGVARVVTEHSFVNGVAAFITGGIYTPMHITVTCAAGTAALDVPTVRSLAEARARVDAGEDFLLPMGRGPNSE